MATAKFSSIKFLLSIAATTILFCFAIGFNISPLLRGPAPYPPEWQWSYEFVNTLGRLWAPGVVGLLGIFGLLYFDKTKKQANGRLGQKILFQVFFLIFITLFTLVLQLSVLYFSRAGIGVLLERVINPGISGYFTTAVSINNIGNFLRTFENSVAHFSMRAADHPPFAVLFFSAILFFSQHLQFLLPIVEKISLHHSNIAKIWNTLPPYQKIAALLSTIIIPTLSASVLIPLYFFTKFCFDKKIAIRACFLYAFFPALSLFLPLNDTFLGIFGILGIMFTTLGLKKPILYCFMGGLSLAIGIFFSVSMIVPVLIALIFLFLQKISVKRKLLELLGILDGLICIPIIFFILFHFNTLSVFVEITRLQAKRSYFPWIFYNLYDFFIFSGIPVLLCSIMIIKAVWINFIVIARSQQRGNLFMRLLHYVRNDGKGNSLTVSFLIVLFLLDISGFSRAETGRIWMPYMPILAVIVAVFLTRERRVSTSAFAAILVLQFIQLFVMQEFWVTLW